MREEGEGDDGIPESEAEPADDEAEKEEGGDDGEGVAAGVVGSVGAGAGLAETGCCALRGLLVGGMEEKSGQERKKMGLQVPQDMEQRPG